MSCRQRCYLSASSALLRSSSCYAALKRELSRDAAFMGEVKRKEKARAANVRDQTQKCAIAFLQQQASDGKSGGQGGMNPHLKKKRQEA